MTEEIEGVWTMAEKKGKHLCKAEEEAEAEEGQMTVKPEKGRRRKDREIVGGERGKYKGQKSLKKKAQDKVQEAVEEPIDYLVSLQPNNDSRGYTVSRCPKLLVPACFVLQYYCFKLCCSLIAEQEQTLEQVILPSWPQSFGVQLYLSCMT